MTFSLRLVVVACLLLVINAPCLAEEEGQFGFGLKRVDQEVLDKFHSLKIAPPPLASWVVVKTNTNGPAQRAGIKPGDLVVLKNGNRFVLNGDQLKLWKSNVVAGTSIHLITYRLGNTKNGLSIWDRKEVDITPITKSSLEDDALRCSYIKVDGKWYKLPEIDVTRDCSIDGPSDYLHDWNIGSYGKLSSCKITQVLDKSSCLVNARGVNANDVKRAKLVRVSTEGITDDQNVAIGGSVIVIGTWDYITVLGAKSTALLIVPLKAVKRGLDNEDLKELKSWLKQQ